ncbi:hypothetical protein AB4Y44_10220 [Paraburkholderia sp. BR10937]|uniref:hypothetical protein n=1 Tax=Paraburkholderia sp. BR10937 TaxID=3236994 RepID=UPI0034D35759
MNNQNQSQPMSEAYGEKLATLERAIGAYGPHIVALFEVGTTGKQNLKLVEDMKARGYVLRASQSQEGGLTKYTTLGSMVFVHQDIAGSWKQPFEVPLAPEARRATLLLEREGTLLAFCHANASYKSLEQFVDEMQFISTHGRLIFFGGDLNCPASVAPKSVQLRDQDKRTLELRLPECGGFTHVSVFSSEAIKNERYDQIVRNTGGYPGISREEFVREDVDVYWGDCAVPSFLDYAYVASDIQVRGKCEGAVQIVSIKREKQKVLSTLENFKRRDKVYKEGQVKRLFLGETVRSDHFPVAYELNVD